MIERAHAGDFGPAAALALRSASMSKTIDMGLYLSVACAEQISRIDDATRARAVAGLGVFDDHMLEQMQEICARWPHAAFAADDPSFTEPLRSEIPTLLLSGAHDPITPPRFGEHVVAGLSNARHIVVEHGNHGVWNIGCTVRLSAEFYANPDPAKLDVSCYDALLPTPAFLSANGPVSPPAANIDRGAVASELATHELEQQHEQEQQ